MSQSLSTPVPSPRPSLPDFSALAAKLQETAQALLAFCPAGRDGGNAADTSSPTSGGASGVIRTYLLPDFAVKEEKCLLEECGAGDWQEALHMVRGKLEILSCLMRHFDEEEEVDGFFLNQIVENLMAQPLDMLNRLCSLVADFQEPEPEDN